MFMNELAKDRVRYDLCKISLANLIEWFFIKFGLFLVSVHFILETNNQDATKNCMITLHIFVAINTF